MIQKTIEQSENPKNDKIHKMRLSRTNTHEEEESF